MRAASGKRSHLCVLVPGDAEARGGLGALWPEAEIETIVLEAGRVYPQLRAAGRRGFDVFVNLCDGPLDGAAPSIEVVWQLERLGLAFTGAGSRLRGLCRTLMKYVAHVQGVATPGWVLARSLAECERAVALGFPLRVVPAQAGEAIAAEEAGSVGDEVGLLRRCEALLARCERVVIEREVGGRGYSVVVLGAVDGAEEPYVLRAIETGVGSSSGFVAVTDGALEEALRAAARRIFVGFHGEGYARVDFRVAADGTLYFCEIDFACRLFAGGAEAAALANDAIGAAGFLRHIVAEGAARRGRGMSRYSRRGDASAGFGIFADRAIVAGEVVFAGEERSQRIVTRGHVERTWGAQAQADFRAYAYPLSEELFILWDRDPGAWAPQNHSCAANTRYRGLDVVALRDIAAGEELTLDYADFCDDASASFECRCGAAGCRGRISGVAGNSVTARERARRMR